MSRELCVHLMDGIWDGRNFLDFSVNLKYDNVMVANVIPKNISVQR